MYTKRLFAGTCKGGDSLHRTYYDVKGLSSISHRRSKVTDNIVLIAACKVLLTLFTLGLRLATSHPAVSYIPSRAGPRVLHIPHSIIILLHNVDIPLICYDHVILWDSRERHLFHIYSLANSVFIVIIRPFCQGMHPGIIDACNEDLVSPSDDPVNILSLLGPREFNLW